MKKPSPKASRIGLLLALLIWLPASLAGELAAVVEWGKRLSMGTLLPGIVEKIAVVPGQRVTAGTQLLVLDQQAHSARLRAANAEVRRARILQDEARNEFERAQELYDRTVLSQHELSVAEIGLREAEAEYMGALAQQQEMRTQVDYSQLRAPFDGLVIEVKAERGQFVDIEEGVQELVVLVDDQQLKVRALANMDTLDALMASDATRVKLAGSDLTVEQLIPGYEAVKTAQGQELFPVTAIVQRPQDVTIRAGQAARLVW